MFKKLIILPTIALFLASCSLSQSTKIVTGNVVSTNINENTIEIKNYAYNPSDVSAKAGTIITVTNNDDVAHTVTADKGEFDTGLIQPGKTATFTTPSQEGTYAFHCTPHPYMRGSLEITNSITPTPTE